MYLGIDFGTSGCRACIIDNTETIVFENNLALPPPIHQGNSYYQNANIWWEALLELFKDISNNFNIKLITNICINGTSATVVHCDRHGKAISNALMYNDMSSIEYVAKIKAVAPRDHVTLSPSSALSKMLLLLDRNNISDGYMLNQADWLSNKLCQQFALSDYNNALKMGYDPEKQNWPKWIRQLLPEKILPSVLEPGSTIGQLTLNIAQQFGFSMAVNIKLGTTDSIAAFIATGVTDNQQAVTSLGSTLVLKQLSSSCITNSDYGLYSHKFGRFWLAGGASNSGGKVLAQYFTSVQLAKLSRSIDPETDSQLNYYPLPATGERFPINDSHKQAKLIPRPSNDSLFLKGIFEGIAQIERLGYKKLAALGATYPEQIISCGGGALNPTWQAIRQRIIGVDVLPAAHSQACYGSALLAKNGMVKYL